MSTSLRLLKIPSFVEKFRELNGTTLGLEAYPASYFNHLLSSLEYYCEIYKRIIDLALGETNKAVSELSVLDYGAGNGFLGMFAKHYGFDKVWMCDTSDSFLAAAQKTASVMKISIEDFILGDISTISDYFQKKRAKPDILLATDVIEHIYDLDAFFASLKKINPDLICVFTTASNPFNYYKVKQLRKFQYKDEWVGYKELSKKELDVKGFSPLSFYEQRKKIIRLNFPLCAEELVNELAKKTRGKRKDDIIKSIDAYLISGQSITSCEDPYWVCDPETGSWTERVLPMNEYERLFTENGFNLRVYNGFYNEHKNKIKECIIEFLNRRIDKHQLVGKYVAPFIILMGTPSKN